MKNKIAKAFDGTDNVNVVFRPTPEVYQQVGIRRKRFGQLYRGEKSPLVSELERISVYLQVPVTELI